MTVQDTKIVSAAIHPGIGVMRVGDAKDAFYIGPEVVNPLPKDPSAYRDEAGALKREAARFRIYGLNAAGEVVKELTAADAEIEWTVELANRKADWYRFIEAMDIPETASLAVPRRNPTITGDDREKLAITPGSRSISGKSTSGDAYKFADGVFELVGVPDGKNTKVENICLGELRTDEDGRLLVLGGHGVSASPLGRPPFDPDDGGSFNNADTWYDDIADGPVRATVTLDGRVLQADGAWVFSAPPNYAPEMVGWRTLYDMLVDVYVDAGWMPVPATTSFTKDVLPQLSRLSNLQWVNAGFAAFFGQGCPLDFDDPDFVRRLAAAPVEMPNSCKVDTWAQLRQQIMNLFRPADTDVNEPRLMPWIYGDAFDGDLFDDSPRTMLELPSLQQLHLQRWAAGEFISDYDASIPTPTTLDQVPVDRQPEMLDQAALHFCLADAFHPGCELTWPMRHATVYRAPFRIRERPDGQSEPDYGARLTAAEAVGLTGPLRGQMPGTLTRWMGLPWQGDTAYCRSGYDPSFDPFLPTYWAARVPNQVLTEQDYKIVIDTSRPREERLAAYSRRASWYRFIDDPNDPSGSASVAPRMERMIATFGKQGIVERRDGVADDPDLPPVMFVETLPKSRETSLLAAVAMVAPPIARSEKERRVIEAGWGSEENLAAAIAMRRRDKA